MTEVFVRFRTDRFYEKGKNFDEKVNIIPMKRDKQNSSLSLLLEIKRFSLTRTAENTILINYEGFSDTQAICLTYDYSILFGSEDFPCFL